MAYNAAEARQQLLDTVAEAIDALSIAIAALGAAYEELDEHTGDQLEAELFRPVQGAYGRAQRTASGFAQRHGLRARAPAPQAPPRSSAGVKALVETAVDAVAEADGLLSNLQDSMLPVEVGDPELRAGLSEVRTQLGHVRARAREVVRIFGR